MLVAVKVRPSLHNSQQNYRRIVESPPILIPSLLTIKTQGHPTKSVSLECFSCNLTVSLFFSLRGYKYLHKEKDWHLEFNLDQNGTSTLRWLRFWHDFHSCRLIFLTQGHPSRIWSIWSPSRDLFDLHCLYAKCLKDTCHNAHSLWLRSESMIYGDAIKRHRYVTSQALLTHTSRWKPQAEAGLWVMLKFEFSSGQKVWLWGL